MSQAPVDPPPEGESAEGWRVKSTFEWSNAIAIALVCALVIGAGIGVWQLRPKEPPTGRPIGTAGKIQAFAVPANPTGEGFTIWRDGRQIGSLPNDLAAKYQRIELSSNDVDIASDAAPELVLYAWTGGAHCCFTQIVLDGHSGRLLGQFDLGNGDPMPFLPTKSAKSTRGVAVNFDDVSAYQFGAYEESPMARIVVAWDGKRFSLDKKRMKAPRPESPPAYFISEPDLGDAVPLALQDFGESEDEPAAAPQPEIDTPARGDRAKAYQTWMDGEEARMKATPLNGDDKTSYGPMAAFLNERIYKGQAVAGVATVKLAYATNPELCDAALAYYFEVLSKSRWISDLDRLNDGQLAPLIAKLTSPLPTSTASPYTAPQK
jgi:hypothetical protein